MIDNVKVRWNGEDGEAANMRMQWEAMKRKEPDLILLFRSIARKGQGASALPYLAMGDDAVWLSHEAGEECVEGVVVIESDRLESVLAAIVSRGRRAAVCERVR